jgi:glycosyltransferase involved in cell wall biosynthesis
MLSKSSKFTTRAFDLFARRAYLDAPRRWLVLTDPEEAALLEYGVDRTLMRRVNNGAPDPHVRHARGDQLRFSFVSRLHPRKQPEVFVLAAGMLLDVGLDATFVVAGPDQGAEQVARNAANSTGRPTSFEFPGPFTTDQTYSELATTTALVLPSVGEIAPMIAIESASVGTPLILTSDCGLAAEFEESNAALVVAPTPNAIAEAMMRIAQDAALAAAIGRNARALYERKWSMAALGTSLRTIYAEVTP